MDTREGRAGFDVGNLGACLPMGDLLEVCLRNPPELVVLSTIAGHSTYETVSIIEKAIRAHEKLALTRVVIGGMFTTNSLGTQR